jgi:hypothetical protein
MKKAVDGFYTAHVWFGARVVLVIPDRRPRERIGVVLSVKAFGEYNRIGLVWRWPAGWHVSRGG